MIPKPAKASPASPTEHQAAPHVRRNVIWSDGRTGEAIPESEVMALSPGQAEIVLTAEAFRRLERGETETANSARGADGGVLQKVPMDVVPLHFCICREFVNESLFCVLPSFVSSFFQVYCISVFSRSCPWCAFWAVCMQLTKLPSYAHCSRLVVLSACAVMGGTIARPCEPPTSYVLIS